MARKGTIKNMGKVQREMSDARKTRRDASREIAARIARIEAGESATANAATGVAYAHDGTLKTVSVPVDSPPPSAAESDAEPKPRPDRKGRKPKASKPEKAKRLSGLDAAALVLAESRSPMKAVDVLAEVQKRGLWSSRGRTPEATLYAAIIREIAARGEGSRFKKHAPGLFIANRKGA